MYSQRKLLAPLVIPVPPGLHSVLNPVHIT